MTKRIYLDYAATTPVDPRVKRAMEPYFGAKFGNPGSLHSFGQEAIAAVDRSRETIALAIGAGFREVIFTGSATEANNLALRGAVKAFSFELLASSGHPSGDDPLKARSSQLASRIIVSAIEHESVLETARDLEREGVEIVVVPVSRNGVVDLKKLEAALDERTILVSVMYVNNEIGTVQPIAEIARIVREFREQNLEFRGIKNPYILYPKSYPLVHIDAAQAFQFFDCNVERLGVDLMTLSAHKIYGPKGIGTLYVRDVRSSMFEMSRHQAAGNFVRETSNKRGDRTIRTLEPLLTGGGQEFSLRSGTENVPSIVGFAKAVELISNSRELENKRIGELRERFWKGIKRIYHRAKVNGIEPSEERDTGSHLPFAICSSPHILNVYLPGRDAQDVLTALDLAGVAASSGSACAARSHAPSHVLRAIGCSEKRARQSVRFGLGRPTTRAEVDKALAVVGKLLSARRISST